MFLALSQNLPWWPCSLGKNPFFLVNKSAYINWLIRFSLSLPSSINRPFILRHHLLTSNSPRDITIDSFHSLFIYYGIVPWKGIKKPSIHSILYLSFNKENPLAKTGQRIRALPPVIIGQRIRALPNQKEKPVADKKIRRCRLIGNRLARIISPPYYQLVIIGSLTAPEKKSSLSG